MTATVDFTTVTNAIQAMSISGVTVKDVDEVASAIGLDSQVLAPMPEGFITNVEVTRDEMTGQKLVLRYTLTYRYYHCKIAAGLGALFATYSGMITSAAAILLAFSNDATLTGAMDSDMPQIFNIGPVSDPSGNGYHGFDITLRIMQFLEV